jgi:hypothetical protein
MHLANSISVVRGTLIVVLLASVTSGTLGEDRWDRDAAARYLDARAAEWVTFSRERQKLETSCISCHTAMPYLLARPLLGGASLPEPARALGSDVESRVAYWSAAKVWYDESRGAEKPEESRDTESVLNALVLTLRDKEANRPLSDKAKTALLHMWAQQNDDGRWSWLHFGLGPWEADGSDYWGASLAAVAGMSAGEEARAPAEASAKLRAYLRAGLSRNLSVHNRLSLLWAASVWDGLLSDEETKRLVDEVLPHQRPDGGFRLFDLGPWPSKDGTPPRDESDGYATAFTTFVLQRLGEPRCAEPIARAISWLEQNQRADGRWETLSPNKDRSREGSLTRLLASDAATAFAVLALASTTRNATELPVP